MIIRTIMTFAVVFTLVTSAAAQDAKTNKKVVIVKKTDDNGKITESRTEAEGDEADDLIKKMEAEEGVIINESSEKGKKIIRIDKSTTEKKINSSSDNRDVEISTEIVNGKKKERYKIVKKDENGDRIMEWDGEGEMPEDIKKEIENIDFEEVEGDVMKIQIDANEGERRGNDERIVISRKQKEGDKKQRMIWKEREGQPEFSEGINRSLNFKADSPNTNKVSLGVMIENTDSGVVVTDIVPGSAAESVGLRRGDTILKINDKYVFTIKGLLEALNPFNPDEKVKVKYLREGKEKSGSGRLKAK